LTEETVREKSTTDGVSVAGEWWWFSRLDDTLSAVLSRQVVCLSVCLSFRYSSTYWDSTQSSPCPTSRGL